MKRSISVVIPTYNRAYCLSEAIDSALDQTLQPDEIIVIDDASTDDTEQVLARYSGQIRIIRNLTNQGASQSRNLAVQASSGDYIAFLDSDDAFLPQKLALQMAAAEAHPSAGAICTDCWLVDSKGRYLFHPGGVTPNDACEELLFSGWALGGTALIKREAFNQAGGFKPEVRIAEDYELWSRIAVQGYGLFFVNIPLLRYRVQAHSLTSVHRTLLFESEMRVINNIIKATPHIATNTDLVKSAQAMCHIRAAVACGLRGDWALCDTHLDDAFAIKPEWSVDASVVQDAVIAHTTNPFHANPIQGSAEFLEHVSQTRGNLPIHADATHARICIHKGLLASAIGEIEEGGALLQRAKQLDPEIFVSRSAELMPSLTWFIDELEASAAQPRLTAMLSAVPASEQVRRTLSSRVLSDYHLRNAFREYELHDYKHVVDDAVHAILSRPALVRNRGVLSILGRATFHNVANALSGHGH